MCVTLQIENESQYTWNAIKSVLITLEMILDKKVLKTSRQNFSLFFFFLSISFCILKKKIAKTHYQHKLKGGWKEKIFVECHPHARYFTLVLSFHLYNNCFNVGNIVFFFKRKGKWDSENFKRIFKVTEWSGRAGIHAHDSKSRLFTPHCLLSCITRPPWRIKEG